MITAMPDFRGPTVSPVAIGKDSGGATGFIKTGATYRVYAKVTDVGAPPSGTATVTANASNVTAGQVAVPLVAGSYTAGGVSYNYRSAVLTAGTLAQRAAAVLGDRYRRGGERHADQRLRDDRQHRAGSLATSRRAAASPAGPRPATCSRSPPPTRSTPVSLLANWTGAATTVQVRIVNQGGGDRLQVWDSAGLTQIPFGTINLGRTDFTTSDAHLQRLDDDASPAPRSTSRSELPSSGFRRPWRARAPWPGTRPPRPPTGPGTR